MSDIKIRVVYEPYRRYEASAPRIGHITAKSFRRAIMKMLSRVHMYDDANSIYEFEEVTGRQVTQQELIERLEWQNGDGCDYIISLINETTGEVYMSAEEFGFQEWSI